MQRVRRAQRFRAAIAAVVALAAAGCSPPTVNHAWVTRQFARTVSGDTTVIYAGAWTSNRFFVALRAESSPTPTGDIRFFPRSGSGGTVLGSPQIVPSTAAGFQVFGDPDGHLVGTGVSTVAFFAEDNGVWAPAGSFTLPADLRLSGLTDEWLVASRGPGHPSYPAGEVRVYALSMVGTNVTATLAATLTPSSTLSPDQLAGFGIRAVIDGDLIAVAGGGAAAPAPGYVQLFRNVGGTWTAAGLLGGQAGDPQSFGLTLAVDDGPTVDRVALAPQVDTGPRIGVWSDTGSGFNLEASIQDPTTSSPPYFGGAIALDGNRLSTTMRNTSVASADPLHDPVSVATIGIFRRSNSGNWSLEKEVKTYTNPAPAGVKSSVPAWLQMSGTNIAVTQLVTPDPPPGCPFPCFVLGMEAWSIGRT